MVQKYRASLGYGDGGWHSREVSITMTHSSPSSVLISVATGGYVYHPHANRAVVCEAWGGSTACRGLAIEPGPQVVSNPPKPYGP